MENEKLENDARVTDKASEFYQKPFEYGLHLFVFYKCEQVSLFFFISTAKYSRFIRRFLTFTTHQCPGIVYGGHRNCGPAGAEEAPAAGGEGQGNIGGLSRLCKEVSLSLLNLHRTCSSLPTAPINF